ncbi:Mth938-like domain-containing protein [Neisseriaceae bacterium B1]
MEIIATHNPDFLSIDGYQAGEIIINETAYHTPILLNHQVQSLPENWQPENLNIDDFQAALNAGADVIIIGTGDKQRFLPPQLAAQLSQHGLGLECMATAAACRTIMLLQSEGRKVWAWLLV